VNDGLTLGFREGIWGDLAVEGSATGFDEEINVGTNDGLATGFREGIFEDKDEGSDAAMGFKDTGDNEGTPCDGGTDIVLLL
jgi:hypothetical protein